MASDLKQTTRAICKSSTSDGALAGEVASGTLMHEEYIAVLVGLNLLCGLLLPDH